MKWCRGIPSHAYFNITLSDPLFFKAPPRGWWGGGRQDPAASWDCRLGRRHCCYGASLYTWSLWICSFMCCLESCAVICLCVYAGTRSIDGACRPTRRIFPALMWQHCQHEGQEHQKVSDNTDSLYCTWRRILMISSYFPDCPSPKAISPGWQNVLTFTMRTLTLALCRWGFYSKLRAAWSA